MPPLSLRFGRRARPSAFALALVAAALAGACATPAYYAQAVGGQWELWRKARPIAEIRDDANAAPALKNTLATVERIRAFASSDLALPANGSYTRYVDLRRPYVVWNVFAAAALSTQLKEWCFPIAGCVGYRGYFAEQDAKSLAAELRNQGYDVYVGGVPAYSTLGWFNDPVLNTFTHYPETEIARLIFHELAHQLTYVADDSEFNESFASAVETVGVERWLAHHGSPAKQAAFDRAQRYRQDFSRLVLKYRDRLQSLYESNLSSVEKLHSKTLVLSELKNEYQRIKEVQWSGYRGYDRWFGQDINNATLASIGLYNRLVPAFRALLAENGDDLPRFYAAVKRLGALPKDARQVRLSALLERSSPANPTAHSQAPDARLAGND